MGVGPSNDFWRRYLHVIDTFGFLDVVEDGGMFPDGDFDSKSPSAQLRENFCRAHTYIFSPPCALIDAAQLYLTVAI